MSKQLRFLTTVGVALIVGCAPQVGNLSGTVLVNNEPLPTGRITLHCSGGEKPALFAIVHDGNYRFLEVPLGPAAITVETFPPAVPGPSPPEARAPLFELPVEGMEDVKKIELLGPYVPIPPHYRDPNKSGLTVTILRGEQQHDVALKVEEEAE